MNGNEGKKGSVKESGELLIELRRNERT